jgi:CRISPR-associated protein Csx10
MYKIKLTIELLSDTCLGSGAGLAGLVDQELLYDSLGFPMANGKTIKGWLVEACADIISGIQKPIPEWLLNSSKRLFGNPGDGLDETLLFIGDAHFPDDIRAQEIQDFKKEKREVIENRNIRSNEEKHQRIITKFNNRINANKTSYSRVRHQTAIEDTGIAKDSSLRTIRVINSGNTLISELHYLGNESDKETDLALLCAVVSCVRRIGLNRTRGLGKVRCSLSTNDEKDFYKKYIKTFIKSLSKEEYESH